VGPQDRCHHDRERLRAAGCVDSGVGVGVAASPPRFPPKLPIRTPLRAAFTCKPRTCHPLTPRLPVSGFIRRSSPGRPPPAGQGHKQAPRASMNTVADRRCVRGRPKTRPGVVGRTLTRRARLHVCNYKTDPERQVGSGGAAGMVKALCARASWRFRRRMGEALPGAGARRRPCPLPCRSWRRPWSSWAPDPQPTPQPSTWRAPSWRRCCSRAGWPMACRRAGS